MKIKRYKKSAALISAIFFISGCSTFDYILFGDSSETKTEDNAPSASVSSASVSSVRKVAAAGGLFSLVEVDGGTFQMGSDGGSQDETPAHKVTVSGFYMAETEITQGVFKSIAGKNPSKAAGDRLPVENVTFQDAVDFCNALSEREGLEKCYYIEESVIGGTKYETLKCDFSRNGYRLPTEAEWEFAARGGNKSKGYKWSGGDAASVAQFNTGKTMPVAGKSPNELGLYDMSGNVEEWVADKYQDYSSEAATDPNFFERGSGRITRGGSYMSTASGLTVTARANENYASAFWRGFRVVRNMGAAKSIPRAAVALKPMKAEAHRFNMVLVEGGTFQMGSNDGFKYDIDLPGEQEYSEKPVHSVTLDSFYIAETELTQEIYRAITGLDVKITDTDKDGKSVRVSEGDNCPIHAINWYEAAELCNILSEKEGLEKCYSGELGGYVVCDFSKNGYRLPTEAEWEYAARGGRKSKGYKYSGSNDIDEVAWHKMGHWRGGDVVDPQPVAQKKPNELGLYDMSGNVSELCYDYWDFYSAGSAKNPTGPACKENGKYLQVIRGGDGAWDPVCHTVSFRGYEYRANMRQHVPLGFGRTSDGIQVGMRLVRSANNAKIAKSAIPKANSAVSTAWNPPAGGNGITVSVYTDGVPERIPFLGRKSVKARETAALYTRLWGDINAGMRLVRGGTFQMGSEDKDYAASPVHSVTLSSFYISEMEITQSQYAEIMGKNPSWNKQEKGGNDLPVEMVSWFDAVEFCNALSEKEGLEKCYTGSGNSVACDFNKNGYRLPTEAEWEFAARGGMFCGYFYERFHPWPVYTRSSHNRLGICDMTSDKLGEWCWDRYGAFSKGAATNPIGPDSGAERVVRTGAVKREIDGGGFINSRYGAGKNPESKSDRFGFRVVRNAE